MKTAEKTMGLLMGLSLSFILTLTGILSSGRFTIPSFLISFAISFAISSIITRFVPIKKISSTLANKLKLRPDTLSYRLFDTLISDLLMSPLMTFIMVCMAYRNMTSHGAKIPFGPMLLRSEFISFIVAYLAIFFLTPIFAKYAFRKTGIVKHS